MIDLCIAITVALTCSWWTIEIVDDQETVEQMWLDLGHKLPNEPWQVHGFNHPETKTIVLYWGDLGNFKHEWRHVYCLEYYFYHLARNHPTMCEPFPHFKIQI